MPRDPRYDVLFEPVKIEPVVEQLEASGQQVFSIEPAECFHQLGEERFAIHPERLADHQALIRRLAESPPDRIVHLWTLDAEAGQDHGVSDRIGRAVATSGERDHNGKHSQRGDVD